MAPCHEGRAWRKVVIIPPAEPRYPRRQIVRLSPYLTHLLSNPLGTHLRVSLVQSVSAGHASFPGGGSCVELGLHVHCHDSHHK